MTGKINLTRSTEVFKMNKLTKAFITAAGAGAAFCAAGIAYSAYNSRPMKTKRMVKRATKTMENVGGMLTAMAQVNK